VVQAAPNSSITTYTSKRIAPLDLDGKALSRIPKLFRVTGCPALLYLHKDIPLDAVQPSSWSTRCWPPPLMSGSLGAERLLACFFFPVLAAKREDPRRMRRGQGRKRDCGWFGPLAWWMNRRQAGSRTESTSDISCIQALEGQSRREYSVSGLAPSITKI
jgi:hypothetical protein